MSERIPGIDAELASLRRDIERFENRYDRERREQYEEHTIKLDRLDERLETIDRKIDPISKTDTIVRFMGNFLYAVTGAVAAFVFHWLREGPH